MDALQNTAEMLDLMSGPAFCVKNRTVFKANAAADGLMIRPDIPIGDLLETGQEEYEEFTGGCLYLTLNLSGRIMGASVARIGGCDVFCLEESGDRSDLQAMALAARELREPLAGIMLSADRLFPAPAFSEDPALREQLARMNRGLFQMLRIISNMADAGRYTAETDSRQETRDICGLLDEIFAKAAVLVEQAGLTLTYTGIQRQIYCLVDTEKLERGVFNIISNAVKFTSPGGTIEAELTQRGSKLYLCVTDSGSGIPENLKSSMFTRYTRTPGVEDGRLGIGLGMVLMRCAAALHGGTVLVDQPDGRGTRITMTLAIRQNRSTAVRSNVLRVDYAGERDHGLIELSDSLPASLYEPGKIN